VALTATIHKVDLQVADMDRHYYGDHALTVARHPSETEERMMVRILAFALHAHERLSFGRGISATDEPDLWQRDLTGRVELWIEVGHPDERRLRKACGQAERVVVYAFGGRASELWWAKAGPELARHRNLAVFLLDPATAGALAAMAGRAMRLQLMVQDGEAWLDDGERRIPVGLRPLAGVPGG
jgi:uncharacterized protein YaeQ